MIVGAALTGLGCDGEDLPLAPASGIVTITTSTTGPEPDADGYAVTIDGGSETAIPTSGTLQRDNVEPGDHTIRLMGVAANCTVAGENPRRISLPAGETVTVTFQLSCGATTGSLRISTTTTGADLDPDGYAFAVDGATSQPIGINTTANVLVSAASHTVQLSGVMGNCSVGGTNPQTVTVSAGATAEVSFAVTCAAAAAPLIAFTSFEANEPFVFVVKPDGTGRTKLAPGTQPKWSPDGHKILFSRPGSFGPDLYVMNADGSGQALVIKDRDQIVAYHWSPDGRRISFLVEHCRGTDCKGFQLDLWVMEANGDHPVMLIASVNSDASWSPDGHKLAFTDDNSELHTIDADGSGGAVKVTDQLFQFFEEPPAWSPDGVFIATGALLAGEEGIFLVHPDGTGILDVTPGPGFGHRPRWSPDGSKIAFTMVEWDPSFHSQIAVVNRDGSGRAVLTSYDTSYDWSPDGTQVVLVGEHSEVYVMNLDGTGQTNVSNTPDAADNFPDWRGR